MGGIAIFVSVQECSFSLEEATGGSKCVALALARTQLSHWEAPVLHRWRALLWLLQCPRPLSFRFCLGAFVTSPRTSSVTLGAEVSAVPGAL